ncbi:MAG: DUF1800 family protein [Vicinamibacterales bacterium]
MRQPAHRVVFTRLVFLTSLLALIVPSLNRGIATAHATTAKTRSTVSPVLPAAPTEVPNVTAAGGENRVSLQWTPVANATGYWITRVVQGTADAAAPVSRTGTTYTDTNVTNGVVYEYRVAAFNKGGVGPFSSVVLGQPVAKPTGVAAVAGDRQVAVTWQPSAGASSYTILRSFSSASESFVELATGIASAPYVDANLTNGTKHYYRVRAVTNLGASAPSSVVWAIPQIPPPAAAPTNLTGTPGNGRVTLVWDPVATATTYRIYRATAGVWDPKSIGSTTTTTFKNYKLTNGTAYSYKVAARNAGGDGPSSEAITLTPEAPPAAPTNITALAGDGQVAVSWAPVPGALGYNVYRGTSSNRQATQAVAAGLATPEFLDQPLQNGPTYYYKVTAFNVGGESPRSVEVSASPEGTAPPLDPSTATAFRFLRQATWGPRPGDVETLKGMGTSAFLDQQFQAQASVFPDALFSQSLETAQEHFMRLALTGPDQLRQRVAWALHKIWVVSAVEIDSSPAIVTYYRILLNGAFGNYRDVMRNMTLNPAMGRYLNMLNNRSEQVTGVPPNENYPRELMQLFTIGLTRLRADGTSVVDGVGQPIASYTEADVKELARILTGWTYGDGNPGTTPRANRVREDYRFPMEPLAADHDNGAKMFLGQSFAAGQTATADLEQALDILFNHPNLGPFVSRQLIQQLVTSNPSGGYVQDVAAVFNDNGRGVRGDLAAVVRAILTHPEAGLVNDNTGKLSEPVLFVVSQLRALNATVTDHPFMSDKTRDMGQNVFYPPSVFSYFSPGYRVRSTATPTQAPLGGPEFQILTSVTALERVNFVAGVLGGHFGSDVRIDYAPFTALASDPAALVDYVNLLLMGGQMSLAERSEIIAAVRVSPASRSLERVRTALYLTLVAAQAQVDR